MRLRLLSEVEEKSLMTITVEWMKRKYDEMNAELFDGTLGDCEFKLFTNGAGGANGRRLGSFRINPTVPLKYNKYSGQMFYRDYWGDIVNITKDNFVSICRPSIEMNANYRWTERAALTTLVHEMCHYYTKMNGHYNKKHHGDDFISIAHRVSSKSNGIFTITRLAQAEQLGEMEMIDSAKEAIYNKLRGYVAVIQFRTPSDIRLSILHKGLAVQAEVPRLVQVANVVVVDDFEFMKLLYNEGYKSTQRSCNRYWRVYGQPWLSKINEYNIERYDRAERN